MKVPTFLGKRIREARYAIGIDQIEMSKLLGITNQAVSSYETGNKIPTIYTLKKIADITFHPMSFFLDEKPEIPTNADLQFRLSRVEQEMIALKNELQRRDEANKHPTSA